jgi:hypothetical protein
VPQIFPNSTIPVLMNTLTGQITPVTVHLWKQGELTPSINTSAADCDAAECDFSGYAAKSLVAFSAPFNPPGGGGRIFTGLLQWVCTGAGVENMVGGYYILDADSNLVLVGTLDDPWPMAAFEDGLPIDIGITLFRPTP